MWITHCMIQDKDGSPIPHIPPAPTHPTPWLQGFMTNISLFTPTHLISFIINSNYENILWGLFLDDLDNGYTLHFIWKMYDPFFVITIHFIVMQLWGLTAPTQSFDLVQSLYEFGRLGINYDQDSQNVPQFQKCLSYTSCDEIIKNNPCKVWLTIPYFWSLTQK